MVEGGCEAAEAVTLRQDTARKRSNRLESPMQRQPTLSVCAPKVWCRAVEVIQVTGVCEVPCGILPHRAVVPPLLPKGAKE